MSQLPLQIGDTVTPTGTLIGTNERGGKRTMRSGERYEIRSLQDGIATVCPLNQEGPLLACQESYLERW